MLKRNLHKALALLASVVILCTVLPISALFSAGANGDNLVVNGDFEDGKNGWSFNSGTAEIVADAHDGSSAIQLTNPAAWGEAAIQTVSVDANSEYKIVWYSKRVSGTGAFNLILCQTVSPWGNATTVSGQNWMNETSGNWVRNEYVVNVGDNTSMFFKFTSEGSNAGSILLDDIVMTKVGGDAPGGDQPDVPVADLINGDFETGDVTGWTVYQGTAVKEEAKRGGSYGLHMIGNGGWGGMAFQNIPVEIGKEYTFSMWLKTLANGVNIQIKDGGTDGANLASKWFNATQWTLVEFVVVPTTNTLCINICGSGNGAAESVYLDDVSMTVKGGEQPDQPVADLINGDFETGDVTGWTVYQGTAVKEEAKRGGTYGLHLIGDGGWGGMAFQNVPVEMGKEYTITMWAKALANGANIQIKDGGTDGANLANKWFNTTEWTKLDFVVIPTTNTLCINICGSGNGAAESVYLDDVSMTVKSGSQSDSLLENGDFETGDLSGWLPSQQTVISADAAHNGSYGAQLKGDGGWGGLLDQNLTVTEGKEYVLTFWYKANGGGANFVIKNGGESVAAMWGNATTWTSATLEFTAPAASLLLNICGGGNGIAEDVFVDDFVLTEKAGEEPGGPDEPIDPIVGELQNGDFETGDLTGWTPWQQTAISADAKHDGAYGVHVKGNGGWGGMLEQTFSLVEGKTYTLSFWYKVNANGFNWKLEKDASNNYAAGWVTANQWTKVTADFTAETTSVKLNFCGAGNDIAEDAYIDDVTLIEKPAMPTELVNGDFEKGEEGWTLDGAFSTIVDTAHDGTKALQLANPSAWNEAAVQTIAGEPSTNYVIKWYSKRVEGNGAFNLIAMDGNNENLTTVSGQNWMNETSGNWVENEYVVTTGADGVIKIKITAEAAAAGIILIDDITIAKQGEEPIEPIDPTANLVKNGDFSNGEEGWTWNGNTKIDNNNGYTAVPSALLDHNSAYGEALTQMVKMEKNTDYVIIFYTKRVSGHGSWDLFLMDGDTINNGNVNIETTNGNRWFNQTVDSGWVKTRLEFNSGEMTKAFFKFGPEAEDSGVFLLDDISMYKKGYEPDEPVDPVIPVSGMTLTSFGVVNNRPISADKNLLQNGNFESTGGQWDVDTFHTEQVSVVADSTTMFGSKSLYFNTSALTEGEAVQTVFWMELKPDTSYVFSTWIKGALLADDNRGRATVGVVDEYGKFLATRDILFLDGTRQLVPTSWDDQWHLRSVEFNTGSNTKVGISLAGWGSKMWIDDMALFEVGNGTKYVSKNMGGGVQLSYDFEFIGCDDEDSLIPDPNMKKADESKFWAGSYGWRNGFVGFVDNEYEYGASMKYTSTGDAAATYIIKWVDVEPNTQYTFAVDIKILEDGFGRIGLLDNKKRDKVEFFSVSFDSYDYDDYDNTGWRTVVTSFNTSVYDKIGIAFVDDGGEVLIDNMRFFKNSDGKNVVDYYIDPPADPEDYNPGEDYEDEPVEDEDPQDEEQETAKKKKKKKKVTPAPAFDPMVWVWVGAGSAVALAGAAVTIILLVNKRKKAAAAAAAAAAAEAADEPPATEITSE